MIISMLFHAFIESASIVTYLLHQEAYYIYLLLAHKAYISCQHPHVTLVFHPLLVYVFILIPIIDHTIRRET